MDQQQLLATAFKMTLGLGVVLLVFGGALVLVRKFAGQSKGFLKRTGRTKPMEVLAFQSLGPGRSLYVVRCLNKKILIGATNGGIQHLSDIEDEDEQLEAEAAKTYAARFSMRPKSNQKATSKTEQLVNAVEARKAEAFNSTLKEKMSDEDDRSLHQELKKNLREIARV